MPWIETSEHNARLCEALGRLAGEKGALERLAGAINADKRAQDTERARRGDKHKDKDSLIAAETLFRWHHEGLARLLAAQSHKKRLVYEFLERSPHFRTDLYRPEGHFPQGLLTYIAEYGGRLAQPFAKDLHHLDGAFEVFRPAWTTPERRDRVLISRMKFATESGFTRFREEQDYHDPEFHNLHINEADEGAALFTAANLILLGFSVNGERVKLYVADTWEEALHGPLPVIRLSGTMMGVAGRKQHRIFPFVAIRSKTPFAKIVTGVYPITHETPCVNVPPGIILAGRRIGVEGRFAPA